MLAAIPLTGEASESDPWTYAYIPLADSADPVSEQLAYSIKSVIDAINTSPDLEIQTVSDTALEFAFFAEFRAQFIRDFTWGIFERCIGSNNCVGWQQIERIQMYPQESVFNEARWRFIPSHFHLASIVNVCGVRMGADKLTHFFDDAFHYFNALRSKRKKLEPEDIRQLSLAFEESYMGTRITGIVSRADIEANLAGVRFYSDLFGGTSPIIGRDVVGRLVMLREPDICDYVTAAFDERILPNRYTFSMMDTTRARTRSQDLSRIIRERSSRSAILAGLLSEEELALHTSAILARQIPLTHWQSEFPRGRLIGFASGMMTQWIFNRNFRRVANIFGFDPLKPHRLKDRLPLTIKRADSAAAGE